MVDRSGKSVGVRGLEIQKTVKPEVSTSDHRRKAIRTFHVFTFVGVVTAVVDRVIHSFLRNTGAVRAVEPVLALTCLIRLTVAHCKIKSA